MTTCHQCGSEVADNDSFCPYCGISLAPVAIPSAAEDEFASTILRPPAGSKPSPDPVVQEASPPTAAEEAHLPEPEPVVEKEPETEIEPATLMAEPIPVTPEPGTVTTAGAAALSAWWLGARRQSQRGRGGRARGSD